MRKVKFRSVTDLYGGDGGGGSGEVLEPKGSSGTERQIGRCFLRGEFHKSEESGSCNVCFSLCSTCMHFSLVASLMGTKIGEFSDEPCTGKAAGHCYFDNANALSPSKSSVCNDKQPSNETSNISSARANHAILRMSDTSETTEISLKANTGQKVTENCGLLKMLIVRGNEKQKDLECLGDKILCVTGVYDSDLMNGDHIGDADGKKVSCSPASVTSFPPVGNTVDIQPASHCMGGSKCDEMNNKHTGRPIESIKESSRAFAVFSNKSDLSEISCLRDPCAGSSSPKGEPSEYSEEQVESSLKTMPNSMFGGQICDAQNCAESVKPDTKINDGDLEAADVKSSDRIELLKKSRVLVVEPYVREQPLQSQPVNCNDGSEILEDVKVCDICGDVGRMELLATCSKCTDGAEHTYCMRVKLHEVPEGDWMCEECALNKETKTQNQYKFKKTMEISKKSIDIRKNSGNLGCLKSKNGLELDRGSGVDKSRTISVSSSLPFSSKRPAGDLQAVTVSKRRALETSDGLSRASTPCNKSLFHRFSSFKDLAKGKIEPTKNATSSSHYSSDNTLENSCLPAMSDRKSPILQPQPRMSRGSLFKSKSFNSTGSKVEFQLPKEGGALKPAMKNVTTYSKKDGITRIMSKSMSFSNASSYHSNATNSRGKMLSSKLSHTEDLERLRHENGQNSFQRKSASKLNNSLVSSPKAGSVISASTNDNITSHGEASSLLSSGSNCHGLKTVQGHGKLCDSSKQTNHLAHIGLKYPNEELNRIGKDVRQHAKHSTETAFAIKANGNEWNSSQRKSESKLHNFSVSSPMAGSVVSASTTDNVTSHGEASSFFSGSNCHGLKTVQGYGKSCDSLKQANHLVHIGLKYPKEELNRIVKDVRQPTEHSTETEFAIKTNDSHTTSDERPSLREPKVASMAAIHSTIFAVPELDYLWKGVFEMRSSRILPSSCDGIQAHLSTCASPKVLEVVQKLPHKILLEEVSRKSTWPIQFLHNHTTEDNIALYFFAKDLESYGKNYKCLLECMIKNDLALRGNFDGVELLIFSSNLLPEKSQRWNKLWFLWGVFRGRRVSCSEMPSSGKSFIPSLNSLNVVPSDHDLSVPAMSWSQSLHSSGQLIESLSASKISYNTQQISNSNTLLELSPLTPGRTTGVSESRVSYSAQKILGLKTNFEQQPSRVQTSMKSEQLSRDAQHTDTSLRDPRDSHKKAEMDLNSFLQASRGYNTDSASVVEECKCERMKSSLNETHECNNSRGREFWGDKRCSRTYDVGIAENSAGQSVSPANPGSAGSGVRVKFTQFQALSADGEDQLESGFPNLELSLGTDKKSAKQGAMTCSGITDYKSNQDKHLDPVKNKKNDNYEFLASLSLSLAVPDSRTMQLLPKKSGLNTLLSLFDGSENS